VEALGTRKIKDLTPKRTSAQDKQNFFTYLLKHRKDENWCHEKKKKYRKHSHGWFELTG
jgi:hypothetical protein